MYAYKADCKAQMFFRIYSFPIVSIMFLLDDVLTEYDKAPDDAETADFGAV